jgi:hypothetical protein
VELTPATSDRLRYALRVNVVSQVIIVVAAVAALVSHTWMLAAVDAVLWSVTAYLRVFMRQQDLLVTAQLAKLQTDHDTARMIYTRLRDGDIVMQQEDGGPVN